MSRPRATSRLESTTARLPSIRTNTLDERAPPPNVSGPQLAGTLLARRGQLPQQRSYRSASITGGSASGGGESLRERSPVWGMGGVFPRVSQKRQRPKARDFEEERAQQQARAPRYTSETFETFGTPQIEKPDPFAAAAANGSMERQPTRQPTSQSFASARTNSGVPAPSIRSHATTAYDESSPKELNEVDARSHLGTLSRRGTASITGTNDEHEEEQGQVGGPLNEDGDQWEEEFEGDQWEPPVRNK